MSDRLTLANAIEDAGIDRAKAERVASVVVDLVKGTAATKGDLDAVRTELKTDIAGAKSELQADIANLELRLTMRLAGLTFTAAAGLFAALHYWPSVYGG